MSKSIKSLIPFSLRQNVRSAKRLWRDQIASDSLEYRLKNIEASLEVLINNPCYMPGEDIGFNGQLRRKEIFRN